MLVPSILKLSAFAALAALPVLGLPQDPLARLKQPQVADPATANIALVVEPAPSGGTPVIGVYVTPVDGALAAQLGFEEGAPGVLLANLLEGKPAAKAGLKKYDILVAIDDHPIGSSDDLRKALKGKRAGEEVKVTFVRRGNKQTLPVAVEETQDPTDLAAQRQSEDRAAILSRKLAIEKELAARGADQSAENAKRLADLANERSALENMLQEAEANRKRNAVVSDDRKKLANDLESERARLERSYEQAVAQLESQASRLTDEQRQRYEATARELTDRVRAFADQREALDGHVKDHLESLQRALESKVENLEEARDQLGEHAERARAMIEEELKARADALRGKLGDQAADELATNAKAVAEKVESELLQLRRHLGDVEAEKSNLSVKSATLEKYAHDQEAHARELVERAAQAGSDKSAEMQAALDKRLDSIETRLAHIEDMIGKLLKRNSQN